MEPTKRRIAKIWKDSTGHTCFVCKQGEVWWLDNPELNQRAEEEQAGRHTGDPWEEEVRRHIAGTVPGTTMTRAETGVLVGEVLEIGLGLTVRERDQRAANRVARILRSLKWERRRVARGGAASGATSRRGPSTRRRVPVARTVLGHGKHAGNQCRTPVSQYPPLVPRPSPGKNQRNPRRRPKRLPEPASRDSLQEKVRRNWDTPGHRGTALKLKGKTVSH